MSTEPRMTAEEAEDYTQALGSVLTGGYRLVFQGWRLGVPDALGLTVQQWVEARLGGYIKMAERDRQKAIRAMQAERDAAGEKRMSTRQLGAILGMSHTKIQKDIGGNKLPNAAEETNAGATSDRSVGNLLPDEASPAAPRDDRTQARENRKDRDHNADAKRQDRERREAAITEVPAPDLRAGTLSEALADVTDVDLVVTDPPYPREFLPAWTELAEWAARALKPGALLVAYSGQYHLPEVLGRLADRLVYQWLGWVSTTGPAVSVHQRPISSMGKPLLVFSNGPLREPFASRRFVDVAQSAGRTRELHDWQQDEAPVAYWIDALSERSELVVDPFVGSGTFAKVAVQLGRRFIGCDSDMTALATARKRLGA